jgi:hypothetical protein
MLTNGIASRTFQVRMGLSVRDSAVLADLLLRCPEDVRLAVMDQFWLRTVLIEQRRRMRVTERDDFDARADRILAQLDPQETIA